MKWGRCVKSYEIHYPSKVCISSIIYAEVFMTNCLYMVSFVEHKVSSRSVLPIVLLPFVHNYVMIMHEKKEWGNMSVIMIIKDLRNTNEISEPAHRIDQVIYESEQEVLNGAEAVNAETVFEKLEKKYFG